MHNSLLKRHVGAAASASASASSALVGGNLWDAVPLTDLDSHSCGVEAFEYGHVHVSGVIVHEFFCELRKLWHYVLIILRNLKSALTLGPLIAEDVIVSTHTSIFGRLLHHGLRLLRAIIREPHHLLLAPEILCDAIPFPSITGAIHRFVHIFFKLLRFVHNLFWDHIRHIIGHFFLHNHLGNLLREKLLGIDLAKVHFLQGFDSIIPAENIVTEPIISTSATASATATATATTYQDVPVFVPDYHKSLAEVLTSFRSAYDGYHASGIPYLIRTGAKSFSSSTVTSVITSYLSRTPLRSYFGCEPNFVTDTEVSASSSASASASTSISSTQVPLINPIAPIVPVESEIISSSATASATATVTETETEPVISPAPIPLVSPCTPQIEPIPTSSPVIVSDTVKSTVSESSSSSVAVTTPKIGIPNTLGNTATAAAASSTSASSALNVAPVIAPLLRRYRPKPILSTPTATSASSSSASASSSNILVEPNQRLRNPLLLPRVLPAVDSSIAAASSTASSVSASGGLASSASSVASNTVSAVSPFLNRFNFVFPREKIINALGYDCLQAGDIVTVTLKNRSTLFGRVFDASSPIAFRFLRPRLYDSVIRNSGRIWNLLPRDFRDPECIEKLNNPLLLRYEF